MVIYNYFLKIRLNLISLQNINLKIILQLPGVPIIRIFLNASLFH